MASFSKSLRSIRTSKTSPQAFALAATLLLILVGIFVAMFISGAVMLFMVITTNANYPYAFLGAFYIIVAYIMLKVMWD